jgi:ubiquinone/menaquinone biosynthesis C-methylase UbiE
MQAWHASRTAAVQAEFFIPHLRPGMRLLDLGCGPGTITVGLAELVAPGEVVGVEMDAARVEQARALAHERGLTNVTIHEGDVQRLPFPDSSFDAVFEHMVFMHLPEPARAAAEAFRVLKPGGCFGGRDGDHLGWIWSPPDRPLFEEAHPVMRGFLSSKGSNYFFGRQLASVLRRAGFGDLFPTASYELFNTPESRAVLVGIEERLLADPKATEFAQGQGYDLGTQGPLVLAELRAWAADPDAFVAQSRCEVVGWKP